jgi:hypothetical protein
MKETAEYQGPVCEAWQARGVSLCDHDSCWAVMCGNLVLTESAFGPSRGGRHSSGRRHPWSASDKAAAAIIIIAVIVAVWGIVSIMVTGAR